jgi:hypothetical protein
MKKLIRLIISFFTLPGGTIIIDGEAWQYHSSGGFMVACDKFSSCSKPERHNYIYNVYTQNDWGWWSKNRQEGKAVKIKRLEMI